MTGLAISVVALVTTLGGAQGTPQVKCIDIADAVIAERVMKITVTAEGTRLLPPGSRPFLQVKFTGQAASNTTTRLLEGTPLRTEFLFTRDGRYLVTLASAPRFTWPREDAIGSRVPGCAEQDVELTHREVKEFAGTRGHGWIGVRLLTSVEVEGGASIYFGRLGFASTVNVTTFGDPVNRWVPGLDVRWRGARGYLGGGVRYFSRKEADLDQFRPAFVAGQELPPLKGLPTWFLFDIRVDDYQKKFWRGLDVSFGLRMDLTGNRQ